MKDSDLAFIGSAQLQPNDYLTLVDIDDSTMSNLGTNKRLTFGDLATFLAGEIPGGTVDSVEAGLGIEVDSTNPAIPIVSLTSAALASLVLADSAVQPSDLSPVATSGDYGDLLNLPTLGSAAAASTSDFATAAQGALANSAVQPGSLASVAFTGDYVDLINQPTLSSFGLTASASELNVLDGITASTTELNYVDGVTSAIQTQLNAKQATITGGASSIATSNLTTSRALVSDGTGKVSVSTTTSTQIGYLNTLSSNVQTQLNGKASLTDPLFVDRVRVRRSGASPGWDAGMQVTTDWHNTSTNALYIHSPGGGRIIFGVDTQPVGIIDFSFVGSVSGFPNFNTQDNTFVGGNGNTGIARGTDGWAGLQLSGNRAMGDPAGGGIAFYANPTFDAPSFSNERMYLRSDGQGLDVLGIITSYTSYEATRVGHDDNVAYLASVAGAGGGTVRPLELRHGNNVQVSFVGGGLIDFVSTPLVGSTVTPNDSFEMRINGVTVRIPVEIQA